MIIVSKNDIYMSVFRVNNKEKFTDFSGSTSEKKQDGTYVNSYWNVRLVGNAHNNLKGKLNDKDRIVIHSCKLTSEMYEKYGVKCTYPMIIVFEAEKAPYRGSAPAEPPAPAKANNGFEPDDDELPF